MKPRINLLSFLVVIFSVACPQVAHAAITISNIELTQTSLTFDLYGTVDDVVGTSNKNALYIGRANDGDWYSPDPNQSSFTAGTWTLRGGTLVPNSSGINQHSTLGDFISLARIGGETPEHDVIQYLETIDGTFSVTNGNFNPEATDTSQWSISVGYNGTAHVIDDSTKTGSAVIPEPTSFALFGLGCALLALRRRRGAGPTC